MPAEPYGWDYQKAKQELIAAGLLCVHCGLRQATVPDHQPPLALHEHVRGSGCCELIPSCAPCSWAQGGQLSRPPAKGMDRPLVPEPVGFPVDDPIWDRATWLDDLRDVPDDATWPTFMSAPHPRAVGSYGEEAADWAWQRRGRPWRWWQKLDTTRLLEHDDRGELVWETLLLTLARQLGKSWWLCDICGWRLEQGDRFGAPQVVLSTARELNAVREMWRPALSYANAHRDRYLPTTTNGREQIEYLADGSRWLARSRVGGYGLTVSMATVDESWDVPLSTIEDMIEPGQVSQPQTQLILVSTAHRRATVLMVSRRAAALEQLASPVDSDLLIEWSAPRDAPLDDRRAWRQASPHWDAKREKLIGKQLARAMSGVSDDADEPDPEQSFRTQWLNQWPQRRESRGRGEPLLDMGRWAELDLTIDSPESAPGVLALEDNYGQGAAAAGVIDLGDGRVEVGGFAVDTWDEAVGWIRKWGEARPGSKLLVGASLVSSLPDDLPVGAIDKAGSAETRRGLPQLRSMVAERRVVHDGTPDLDAQIAAARVVPATGGLQLVVGPRCDLLKAAVWALGAESPGLVPMIYPGKWPRPT